MILYIIFFFLNNHAANSYQVLDVFYPWDSIAPALAVGSFHVIPSPDNLSA